MNILFVLPYLKTGGVSTVSDTLAATMQTAGHTVSALTFITDPDAPRYAITQVTASLGFTRTGFVTFLRSFIPLCRYLHTHRQIDGIIVASEYPSILTILAVRLTRHKARIIVNSHINLSTYYKTQGLLKRLILLTTRLIYPLAYAVANVSDAAARDAEAFCHLRKVHTLYNPVVTETMLSYIPSHAPHEWLDNPAFTTLVACGRPSVQKNYPLMLQAFQVAQEQRPNLRLIILGEGELMDETRTLAMTLGINDSVHFAGNVTNAADYFYFARALWLTSLFEGLPTVLIEALATGTPCLAVDCPSGPREILQPQGSTGPVYGCLVESYDVQAHAAALIAFLQQEAFGRDYYRGRAADFSVAARTQAYVDLLAR